MYFIKGTTAAGIPLNNEKFRMFYGNHIYIALLFIKNIGNLGDNDMKFYTGKNQLLWVWILKNQILCVWVLIAVVAAILIYRTGFLRTVPGFDEEKMKSFLENSGRQEAETKQNTAEPAGTVNSSESVFQPSQAVDHSWELQREPRYGSENPLYFCVVFGNEGKKSMLGVVDESGGTGAGYDAAYIDENMNGDLTDEAVKKFPRVERGNRAGELEPRFEFTGPFKGKERAKYTLYIYSLTRKTYSRLPGNEYFFHWFLDINQWNYFFINGRLKLFSNAADAMKGKPVRLGGLCNWQISSGTKDGRAMVSAGLKDINGCTLRTVRRAGNRISPTLTLIQDGKVRTEEKMKFG